MGSCTCRIILPVAMDAHIKEGMRGINHFFNFLRIHLE